MVAPLKASLCFVTPVGSLGVEGALETRPPTLLIIQYTQKKRVLKPARFYSVLLKDQHELLQSHLQFEESNRAPKVVLQVQL